MAIFSATAEFHGDTRHGDGDSQNIPTREAGMEWQQLSNADKDLFPLLECFTSIAQGKKGFSTLNFGMHVRDLLFLYLLLELGRRVVYFPQGHSEQVMSGTVGQPLQRLVQRRVMLHIGLPRCMYNRRGWKDWK
ncbi:hypothetical protein SLEP1_g5017 [Rubroshorea leprosula]|uniref:Uncharacterized protein n=1 Tax=Rubroshorea leprosula TaxID=152421 RepID=A0AAV5HWI6_9ROSI|nr:hypothetical protein SLEP1_g5017 [Rubroshorea leprosula]